MTEIEKMRRYIENTRMDHERSAAYTMRLNEMIELARLSNESAIDAICIAFEYGKAKGERHASKRMVG